MFLCVFVCLKFVCKKKKKRLKIVLIASFPYTTYVQTEKCRQSAAGKKTLKDIKLGSPDVDKPIFINDSLCTY